MQVPQPINTMLRTRKKIAGDLTAFGTLWVIHWLACVRAGTKPPFARKPLQLRLYCQQLFGWAKPGSKWRCWLAQ